MQTIAGQYMDLQQTFNATTLPSQASSHYEILYWISRDITKTLVVLPNLIVPLSSQAA